MVKEDRAGVRIITGTEKSAYFVCVIHRESMERKGRLKLPSTWAMAESFDGVIGTIVRLYRTTAKSIAGCSGSREEFHCIYK